MVCDASRDEGPTAVVDHWVVSGSYTRSRDLAASQDWLDR